MSVQKTVTIRAIRRRNRTRSKLKECSYGKFRISIHRTLLHISAQLIDDANHRTLLSASSQQLSEKTAGKKSDIARSIGLTFGKNILAQGIHDVYVDRGSYRYHGRIRALVDGIRDSGLKV